jgi:hypothetical protein
MKKGIAIGIIIGILLSGIVVCAGTLLKASDVSYNETTVDAALNELFDLANKKGPTKVDAPAGATYKGIVYLDPVDLSHTCDTSNSVSTTETKTGCMKWYIYSEDDTSYTMILDHNSTAVVEWNSSNVNTSMNEAKSSLTNDIKSWDSSIKSTARLITADEVATITGNTTFNVSTATYNNWWYFDTYTTTAPKIFSGIYGWLYDNTYNCTSYGCNIEDNSSYTYIGRSNSTSKIYGYWTSTPTASNTNAVWRILYNSSLTSPACGDGSGHNGIRPVITISKSIIS